MRLSWGRSRSCGRSSLSSPTSGAASGTAPPSMPPATSSPPTATPTTALSAPPASTSTSPSSPRGGCIIVDSTRKGKRFPDSMSKTIPIWACVLNCAIRNHLRNSSVRDHKTDVNLEPSNADNSETDKSLDLIDWDSSLHLPLWVSKIEKASIEGRIEEWTKQFEVSGADIDSLVSSLKKPLRPLWISPRTVIWLNEVPSSTEWDFTPIVLVSASCSQGATRQSSISQFSWHYIAGAGDDEESWARGLTPELFWKNAYEIIGCGPDLCNQKVAELVEKDRVYRAQRGENAPQITIKNMKERQSNGIHCVGSEFQHPSSVERCSFSWIGSTNLGICPYSYAESITDADYAVLNCDVQDATFHSSHADAYLHLNIQTSKLDRFSLLNSLPAALDFATAQLSRGRKLLVCCSNGEDISVCVTLGILASIFDEEGTFDGGMSFMESSISKWDIKKRLIFICKYAVSARPCRGNLRQVFNFLCRRKESLLTTNSTAIAA